MEYSGGAECIQHDGWLLCRVQVLSVGVELDVEEHGWVQQQGVYVRVVGHLFVDAEEQHHSVG